MPAFRAFQPQDTEDHGSRRCFHAARVVPVDVQTAGMAAGAEDAMDLERIDDGVIKILRNRIVFIDEDCYHSICDTRN